MIKKKYIKLKMYYLYLFVSIVASGQIILNSMMMVYITDLIIMSNSGKILNVFLIFSFLNILFFLIAYIKVTLRNNLLEYFNVELKKEYINISLKQDFNHQHSGKYVSFLTNDLKILEANYFRNVLNITDNLIVFVISLSLSLYFNVVLTLVFLIFSLIPGILPKIFSKRISDQSKTWINKNDEFISLVNDSLAGLRTMKIFSVKDFFSDKLYSHTLDLEYENKKLNNIVDNVSNLINSLSRVSFLIPLVTGAHFVINNHISLGVLMGMIQNANSIVSPILQIFNSLSLLKTTTNIWEKYDNFINSNKKNNRNKVTTMADKNMIIKITNFSVLKNNKPLFKPVSICIEEGDKILITGSSGVGKSSFLNILQGVNRDYVGEIKINGVDIAQLSDETLSKHFTMVQQEPFLFAGTIKENILMGRDGVLSNIVKQSGLEKLIKDKGINYRLEESGKNLSGGQKQRIEIARALVTNSSVLLLDEYVSAIDKTERKKIYENLFKSNKTIVEVTHVENDFMRNIYSKRINLTSFD